MKRYLYIILIAALSSCEPTAIHYRQSYSAATYPHRMPSAQVTPYGHGFDPRPALPYNGRLVTGGDGMPYILHY
jgi:hypothetical protein